MGLSNFPSAGEGVLPVLVMNTVLSVALLKNFFMSVLQIMGVSSISEDPLREIEHPNEETQRRVSITQFKFLSDSGSFSAPERNAAAEGGGGGGGGWECSVCLSKFEEEEEVSELSCKHFFHRSCLQKWFDNQHATCPLCRSIH